MNSDGRGRRALQKIKRFLLTTVIGGFVVVLPIGLLVVVIQLVWNTLTGVVSPIRDFVGFSSDAEAWLIDLISVAIILVVFFLIGLLVRTGVGRRIHTVVDTKILAQIPFYKPLRDTVQQFFGRKKMPFSRVVLAEVMNTRMTGFVTDEHDDGTFTIFVPTAPNPTNGFIFHVKSKQVTFLDVRPEEAMRTIFGMGTGSEDLLARKKGK